MPDGRQIRARTVNVSDGGTYFLAQQGPEIGEKVTVRLAVPRDTANTFFLEQFAAQADVVRKEKAEPGDPRRGVALRFEKPLELDLA
jgi:c-di-GMP-binding flagellar brake protein YcgR